MSKSKLALMIILIFVMVIFAILILQITATSPCPGGGCNISKNEAISNLVKFQFNEPGLPKIYKNIIFSNGDSLDSEKIAVFSKVLLKEQVCVLLSETLKNQHFTNNNGESVTYNGSFSKNVSVLVLCDYSDSLEGCISAYEYDLSPYDLDLSGCSTFNNNSEKRYCAVAVIDSD